MRTPVRQLSQSTVFRGSIFHVERDRVRLANGRTATLDIVRHRGSVVLVPQPDRRHVILIRQYRHALGRWIWELPAGSREAGEAPARAAWRECGEEIGLVPQRLDRLGAYYPTPGFCDEYMIFYRCRSLVARPAAMTPDEDEDIVTRSVAISDARAMVERGEIVDLKTAYALTLL